MNNLAKFVKDEGKIPLLIFVRTDIGNNKENGEITPPFIYVRHLQLLKVK
uniref:Uncharacterized protein n=1 Tax=Meloidogyne enterolobii TaxID=390850 RepID=A0A6V7UZN7_MELEN|nr:unnamed protein product [Meloidogyne enterolobii]